MRRRTVRQFGVLVLVMAVFPAAAGAQPAASIVSDFAAHGKLTRTYTRGELEIALQNVLRERYPSTAAPKATERAAAGAPRRLQLSQAALGTADVARPALFDVADLGLMVAGAGGLLILGGALRHVARND